MLLLLPAVCEAQSGDGDPDMGKKILKHAVSTGMLGVILLHSIFHGNTNTEKILENVKFGSLMGAIFAAHII